jgi:mono/diheme cytochrome c family protein
MGLTTSRVLSALAGAGLLTFAVLPSHASDEGDSVLAPVGKQMFEQYCASCHGTAGKGDGPAASALEVPPADLTRIAARRGGNFPDAEIARVIDGRFDLPAHGSREMPVWGRRFGTSIAKGTEPDDVARGRILTLVEYLKTIQVR